MDKFIITPERIHHTQKPAFKASWFSGVISEAGKIDIAYHYEGSGGDDRLTLYDLIWTGEEPDRRTVNEVMNDAITALDHWISERF